ncbi:MAG: Na+/H+ antiporter subunit D [Paenibacillaceae bacterium ZCTH02-B3]|nr:MAG: Na+/H+ antiporter subunit D [Paenibacillaceae bacterium ZCTH02-B3]
MNNNLVVLPIVIPLLAGAVMIFLREYRRLQRVTGILATGAAAAVAGRLVDLVAREGIQTLQVGGWPAPYGITLVADMLSALLVFTAQIVALACLLYTFDSIGEEHESHYIYPLMQFLLCGVNGSFLTGDIFNLFVFFEVTLIASYVLLALGGMRVQLRESLKYVLINMVASTLFVIAIGYLYGVTGALNMAHLSERVAAAGQGGLLTVVSLLFLIVFGIKAALFLYVWLPDSYSAPPPAVAAIFAALLTKVGIYAIMRTFTLIFYHEPRITHTVMLAMGALTMIFGAMGAVAYWSIRKILAYNVIVSVGFIVFAVGVASRDSLSGALYYLLHDMVAKALIFILGGAIISIAGTDRLREINGLIRYRPMLGWLFFVAALALAGIPPLSGFVGKAMILGSGIESGHVLLAAVGLLSSLLVLYSVMKVFMQSFWGETLLSEDEAHATGKGALLPGSILAALVIGLGLGADWVLAYVDIAAETMVNPVQYIDAVLAAP